jgi:hypothetical protein
LTRSRPDAKKFVAASEILQQLHDEAPAGHVTLGWLMGSLHKQSFGLIMLLLAVVATVPGICLVAGLLLMITAFQMIAGRSAPIYPRWIAARPLPRRHLGAVVQRAIPMLRYLERTVHPRWPIPLEVTKRAVGLAVITLSARLILAPIPLSNIIPALVIALISLAYLEEDGLMLSIGFLAGFVVLAVDLGVVWEIIHGAKGSRFSV